MADLYGSMTELLSVLSKRENIDWKIESKKDNEDIVIFAPHGGSIEPGTTELAQATSEIGSYSYFSFLGLKSSNNFQLHITSTNYDEPTLLDMQKYAKYSVAYHGASGEEPMVLIGGADFDLRKAVAEEFDKYNIPNQPAPKDLAGKNPSNIVNRNLRGQGLQLELTMGLRRLMFKDGNISDKSKINNRDNWTEMLYNISLSVFNALESVKKNSTLVDNHEKLFVTNYDGESFPLLAVKTINEELNGNNSIELKVPQQKNNELDLKKIDKLWEVTYRNVEYKIVHIKQITKGNSFYLDIRAIPLFYWDMDKQIIHENMDGHYTGRNAFDVVFKGSGYEFVLVDYAEAIQIEGFGKGETRLEMFKRLLDRFKLEFYIVGKTVYIRKLIGNDTNFLYKYKLNASNISKTIDSSEFFTYIKGFGNFEQGSEDYLKEARLKQEYTSPLAKVVGKYEGKPIVDGRITESKTLRAYMKRAVEDSLKISIDGNLHDVRKIYREAIPVIGDRVFLIDERIDLEIEIRIQSLKRTFDIKDKLIECDVTFGSESTRSSYKNNLISAAKGFNDLMTGDIKLPIFSLEEVAQGMITKIHASENELRYGSFGIQAIDKKNPNNIFGLNSRGWYISTDGGRTARTVATADGIVADAITTGTLRAITVDGVQIYGSEIFGGEITQEKNGNTITLKDGQLTSYIGGVMAMRWTDWTQEFFNADGSLIGSIQPTKIIGKEHYGLGINVEEDFLSIGHMRSGVRRPVFRTQDLDGQRRTMLAGMYDARVNSNKDTELFLGANSMYSNPYFEDGEYDRVRQASIIIPNKPSESGGNSIKMFVGGYGRYAGEHLEVRRNTDQKNSERIAYISSESVEFPAVANTKTTYTNNMLRVSSKGQIQISSSSRRYKLNEKVIPLDYAEKILDLNAKKWIDKFEYDATGNENEVAGLIAEDLDELGLDMFVTYDEIGRPDSLSSNIWVLFIPLIKKHEKEIKELKEKLNA